ncbi:MAG TPA: hypothetical protein G4N97_01025 [Thermoflexia bacterium]|nr:MAG: hypothetical protein DRI80_15485 [Chloroflexota bacterium]HEY66839.1 hypothetical protein [Thermoflexia bacterium]
MTVTTIKFHELVRALETHPRWRAELREVLFPQEFLDLPGAVKELAEAQRRTEEALVRLTERMERGFAEAAAARAEAAADRQRIWQAIRETNERMEKGFAEAAADRQRIWEAMEKGFAEAAEDRRRIWEAMEKGFAEAAEDRRRIWQGIERLADQMYTMTKDIGSLKGTAKELWYQNRAASIFGLLLSRGHDVANRVADRLYEAQKQGIISHSERKDALAADLFWKGRRRENGDEVVLVVEVSWLVEKHDVERAERRAKILRRVGIRALPVAAGEVWGEGAKSHARLFGVVIFEDGQPDEASWQEALGSIEAID